MDDYDQLIEQLLLSGQGWLVPTVSSLRSRMLCFALYKECLRAFAERSDVGARFELVEFEGADHFELRTGERRIGFERRANSPMILLQRDGFPSEMLPRDLTKEVIEAPYVHQECKELARQLVNSGIRLLSRRLE